MTNAITAAIAWLIGACVGGGIGWLVASLMNRKAARFDREIIEYWIGRTREAENQQRKAERMAADSERRASRCASYLPGDLT